MKFRKQIDKTMRWEGFRLNVNTDSGMMNTDSGNAGKVFTLNRNERSRTTRLGVHVEPEWLFTLGRNMRKRPFQAVIFS